MKVLLPAFLAISFLASISLFVGAGSVSPGLLFGTSADDHAMRLLVVSRIPRTLAILLAGSSLAIAGLVMQMIVRNRFVEPSTTGTTEAASLGFLVATILAPGASIIGKMLVSAAFALAGTALFLRILRAVPLRDAMLVPLVGIMLGGVTGALATFLAYRFNLLPSLLAWTTGDFSGVLRGRYELLWLGLAATGLAYWAADRFTLAGMGRDVSVGLGLSHEASMTLGLVLVSVIAAVCLVSVGAIPFLGLVVPNIVSLAVGDNMRRSVPLVALGGAGLVLVCDLIGRLVRYPYEIPIGVVMGVLGSLIFLHLLLRARRRVA
ncbi:ABC transporter permease [Aureimonas phyllosphaerae]|uniref:Iron complex transport system permease protein n=1 Tax=Aureimonas phyllosphaerae TaxID=1166078 RepID=A0A7W6FSV0_9HYPH|nr:iron chelate uptake ABC transporter family permease subunit [Aureimonas phyllosphaerae]MBB3934338.1 iron complex transport system permease protein [Aureimonas phyllosphaerae]MBB3958446.1 iron complex transport system permease protein [Aureimonas phyllosphaerae]SFE97208.1 iron complex transport system permease protein [Aureimonas phyllosphaerae]